jgi:Ni/Co efflux regulator RcnB
MGLARTLLALVAVSVVAAPSLAQQLYKYTGPDGKVQYSDRPPPDGAKAEKITGRASSVAPPAAAAAAGDAAKADAAKSNAPRTAAEQEQEFRKRRLESQEKASKDAKVAEERAARDANCAALRTQLSGVQSGARIAKINAEGERVVLEDDGIQQEAQRLQREIASTCK